MIIDDSGKTNTYAVGTAPELLYQADGTDLDTHWQNFGTISYTFEVNARAQGFQLIIQSGKRKQLWAKNQVGNSLLRVFLRMHSNL